MAFNDDGCKLDRTSRPPTTFLCMRVLPYLGSVVLLEEHMEHIWIVRRWLLNNRGDRALWRHVAYLSRGFYIRPGVVISSFGGRVDNQPPVADLSA